MHFEARIATNPIKPNIHHTIRGDTRLHPHPHARTLHKPYHRTKPSKTNIPKNHPPTMLLTNPRLPPRPHHKHRHPPQKPRGPLNTSPLTPLRNHLDRLPVATPHYQCRAMGLLALPGWFGLIHHRQGFPPEIPRNLSSQGPAGGEQSQGAEERAVGRGFRVGGEGMGGCVRSEFRAAYRYVRR